MTFSFDVLSPADFEDLSRDLLGRELGVRFEAFGPGPDGGIDGRHATVGQKTILQAKHYRLSDFDALARTMTKERRSIDRLAPDRYLLTTSRPLLPGNKNRLAAIIGPALRDRGDILGFEDLNGLLRSFPDVQKSHVKLWLSGSGVLDRILHAATHNFTGLTHDDIVSKLTVYAENPSFKAGRDVLEKNHVLIVSGPPGVGKTTLAEMLCYAYLGEEWDLVAIRSLDEAFAHIDDTRRQVFFFDDFLGRIALDARALSQQDSELARFISRIRRTANARFILTTRAYIYEEARLQSEALSSKRLDVSNYVLDVGIYTRRIRARILYNHLVVAKVPSAHIQALFETDTIRKIVDHEHYNPRIVQALTEPDRLDETPPEDYPCAFLQALDDPLSIWDKAFRTHIAPRCRHLLFAMFLSADHGAEIEDIGEVFAPLHRTLCMAFSLPFGPKDFEEALRTLEGSFVTIGGTGASFVNPSVRDYLARYLNDKSLLETMAHGMATLRAARALYAHYARVDGIGTSEKARFLSAYIPLAARAIDEDVTRPIPSHPSSRRWWGLSYTERIELLRSWWKLSKRDEFLAACEQIATGKPVWFGPWSDGRTLPKLIASLRAAPKAERARTTLLVEALEERLQNMLYSDLDLDDVQRLRESILPRKGHLPEDTDYQVMKAAHNAIVMLPDRIEHIDNESQLEDYAKLVNELGPMANATAAEIEQAQTALRARIDKIREQTPDDDAPVTFSSARGEFDLFDDDDLKSLFAPLLAEEE